MTPMTHWHALWSQWWSWWTAAVAGAWVGQPWPHAGQVEDAPPAALRIRPSAAFHAAPQRERKLPVPRTRRKSQQLQRRKINPG